jgi:hypothetical protein
MTVKMPCLFLIAFFLLSGTVFGQTDLKGRGSNVDFRKNSLYLELLGNGGVYSVNYDRMIPMNVREIISLRVGLSTMYEKDSEILHPGFVSEVGVLSGGVLHFFDAGLGYTMFQGFPDRLIIFRAGYRYMGTKGFMFRAAPMYIYNTESGDVFGDSLWFGTALGYTF